jgi:hypothetical protein
MKKLNYFQVHKNKNPKKLPRKGYNLRLAKLSAIMAKNLLFMNIIRDSAFTNIAQKALAVSTQTLRTASEIQNLFSPKNKYMERINKN